MEAFALLMVLGVRVREVRDLAEESLWLPDDKILFIDSSLSVSRRHRLVELLLADAARDVC